MRIAARAEQHAGNVDGEVDRMEVDRMGADRMGSDGIGADRTKGGRRALPLARIALIAAALVAMIAIGVSIRRNRTPPPAAGPAAGGGDIRTVIAGLEARMRANPADPDGWRLLGLGYFDTARYGDSARAYDRATKLKPGDATLWSALGEARVLAGDGGVNPGAAEAFGKAVAIDPKDPRARYFLAVRKDMGGDHKGAVEDWIALLKDTPAGAPWEDSVRRVTEQVATANKIDIAGRLPAPAPAALAAAPPAVMSPMAGTPGGGGAAIAADAIPGPTRDQMMAASSLPPSQQDAMVRGMVDGLAARLKTTPGDTSGWIRLMRAHMVLGEAPAAAAALAQAKAANPAATPQLVAAARTLGVPGA